VDVAYRKGMMPRTLAALAAALAVCAVVASAATAATVWAVGDGAVPGTEDDALAAYVQRQPIDRLLYLGDVYETGTAAEFRTNYESSWGRFKHITAPTPGNHEWGNHTTGYDPYWAPLAPAAASRHWYSFDLAGWHFVSLNSEADIGSRSAQLRWLRGDLAQRQGTCTVAFWHRARYSAGGHADAPELDPFWRALRGHAVLVLNGHSHDYQRFRRTRGITEIIVGTGGRRPLEAVNLRDARLATADWSALGALRLEIDGLTARYAQVTAGGRQVDRGSVRCSPVSPAILSIRSPRAGATYRARALRRISGNAANAEGAVRLTLVRRGARGRCELYVGRRKLRAASCRTRRAVKAAAHARWSYRLRHRLRRGRYVLTARVASPDGRPATARSAFTVR
jgi:hypothetical protein